MEVDFGLNAKYFFTRCQLEKASKQRVRDDVHSPAYNSVCHQVSAWFPRPADDQPMDIVPYYLMKYIYLYSTDTTDGRLRSPQATLRAQEKYLRMLYRYLKFNYGERGTEAYKQGLGLIAAMRTEQGQFRTGDTSESC